MREGVFAGAIPPLLLGILVVLLGVAVVIRANRMRETELHAERLHAIRDSLVVSNLELQLSLASLCSPPSVIAELEERGYSMSGHGAVRFMLYDSEVPWTGGAMTRRLSYLLPPAWRMAMAEPQVQDPFGGQELRRNTGGEG